MGVCHRGQIIGQIVQTVKTDKLSFFRRPLCQATLDTLSNMFKDMTDANDEFLFTEAFCGRIKALREEKGWVAEQMATALGIPVERYRKYERRSHLPQYLIPRFALVVDRSLEYVLTGKERKPLIETTSSRSQKRA